MASSLFVLIDDIASVLDDISLMTKVAAKKTAGVLGDDLALNAQQVTGVNADRELPVVWAVTKGSFKNKFMLVPAALAINALAPWVVMPLLMLGGAYLCYEGFEKIAHQFLHTSDEDQAHLAEHEQALANPKLDMVAVEKDKVKGAIRTDFILSAEIIVITLGTVATSPFWNQVAVLTGIAIIMTIGVYGLVAGIVKLDDAGLYLSKRTGENLFKKIQRSIGLVLLRVAPYMMHSLSIIGTAAMFAVGGSILAHGIPNGEHVIHRLANVSSGIESFDSILQVVAPTLLNALLGLIAGALCLATMLMVTRGCRMFKRLV